MQNTTEDLTAVPHTFSFFKTDILVLMLRRGFASENRTGASPDVSLLIKCTSRRLNLSGVCGVAHINTNTNHLHSACVFGNSYIISV